MHSSDHRIRSRIFATAEENPCYKARNPTSHSVIGRDAGAVASDLRACGPSTHDHSITALDMRYRLPQRCKMQVSLMENLNTSTSHSQPQQMVPRKSASAHDLQDGLSRPPTMTIAATLRFRRIKCRRNIKAKEGDIIEDDERRSGASQRAV